jgi:hypothetical protein
MTATYQIGVAARAANTTPRKLRRTIDHNVIKLRGTDKQSTGTGDCVGFSRSRVLQIAITNELLSTGMALSKAADAALEFSDYGNQGRAAGKLFETAKTLLVVRPTGAVVVNADFDASFVDLSARGISIIVLDLNKIVAQVDLALNLKS